MNRDLLVRILDAAPDAAPTLADADEIRVLMIDLGLTYRERTRWPTPAAPKPRKPRK